jgi:hypothetical protein
MIQRAEADYTRAPDGYFDILQRMRMAPNVVSALRFAELLWFNFAEINSLLKKLFALHAGTKQWLYLSRR